MVAEDLEALAAAVRPDYPGGSFTAMGWEIWPEGLYQLLTRTGWNTFGRISRPPAGP